MIRVLGPVARAVSITGAAALFLAGCNGSDGTGPSQTVVISDLQARTLERPRADRPVPVEIAVTVSDPARVIGGTAALRRLRTAEDTCQAPGQSPIIVTAPIGPANLQGNRLQIVLRPRLPAGRSRLCFLVGLSDGLPQQARGRQAAETVVAQTNELPLVIDVSGGSGGAAPGPPVVTISAVDAHASESPLDSGMFRVSRTGSTAAPLTVIFSVGGTATSGSDYSAIGTSVVIPAGSATADITVTPIDGPLGEDPETVVVTLSPGAGYTVGGSNSATVTIVSEDPLVHISNTSPTSGPEGDTACPASSIPPDSTCPVSCPGAFDGTIFQITVSRVGSTALPTTVTLGLSGTALPNLDYFVRPLQSLSPTQRLLTIPTGASEAKICFITTAGTSNAGDSGPTETATVTIQPGTGYTVGSPSSTSVTIVEDD